MENDGFGISRHEDILERRVGQYVLIHVNQKSFAGKVKAVDKNDGYITLNPFHGISYETGEPVHTIIDADNDVRIDNIYAIETISRGGLERFCSYYNEEFKKDKIKKKEDREKIE